MFDVVAGVQGFDMERHCYFAALLAESHISIHTWPENGYAAIDVFTCGEHTMPDKACEILRKEFGAQNFLMKSFQTPP